MSSTQLELAKEVAKVAVGASVDHHNAIERLKYEAWKAQPQKGRKAYEPSFDNFALVATFEDLFDAAVTKIRQECKRDQSLEIPRS